MNKNHEVCLHCKLRSFDKNVGVICSITSKKADFEYDCINFQNDWSRQKEIIRKQKIKEKDKKKKWVLLLILLTLITVICVVLYIIAVAISEGVARGIGSVFKL